MTKAKPILLLSAFLFATMGGCFGPLMAGMQSMKCCKSMPCSPSSQSQSCCVPELPGITNHLQQAAKVTAPAVAYAVLATLPYSNTTPGSISEAHTQFVIHCDSPPGDLFAIHHSFLI